MAKRKRVPNSDLNPTPQRILPHPEYGSIVVRRSYAEKLRDPRWQKKRLKLLESANWKCQACGNGELQLHAHHRYYFPGREPWEYPVSGYAILCENCHTFQHNSPLDERWWEQLVGSVHFVLSTFHTSEDGFQLQNQFIDALKDDKLAKRAAIKLVEYALLKGGEDA